MPFYWKISWDLYACPWVILWRNPGRLPGSHEQLPCTDMLIQPSINQHMIIYFYGRRCYHPIRTFSLGRYMKCLKDKVNVMVKSYKLYSLFMHIYSAFTLSIFNTHIYIHHVCWYELHTNESFVRIIMAHMYSSSRTMNHSCSVILTLTHSSEFNANILLRFESSLNASYQNSPLNPHMYHYIEAFFSNLRGLNKICFHATRSFRFVPIPSLH